MVMVMVMVFGLRGVSFLPLFHLACRRARATTFLTSGFRGFIVVACRRLSPIDYFIRALAELTRG